MKKWIAIFLCVCLIAALAGCDAPGLETTPRETTETTGTVPAGEPEREKFQGLEIYYLNEMFCTAGNIVSKYMMQYPEVAVNAVAFESIEEMDRQILADLSSGQEPDIILFTDKTTVDTTKLALNDMLLDLSDMLAEDSTFDPEAYYPVLDAGVIDGRQFLMPLRMRVMYMMTDENKFSDTLGLTEDYTLEELLEALTENAAQCGAGQNAMYTMHSFDTYLYDLIRLTGTEVADVYSLRQSISQDTLLEYALFADVAYGQCLSAAQQMKGDGVDNIGQVLIRNTAVLNNLSLPLNLRYYSDIYSKGLDEELRLLTYPNLTDREALTVDIPLYAAVLKSTEDPYGAYAFVRLALDNGFSNFNENLPVSRMGVESMLLTLGANTGKMVSVGTRTVMIDRMSAERQEECRALLERVTGGSISNGSLMTIFKDTMNPFVAREADFESCYQDFQSELELYLNELYE